MSSAVAAAADGQETGPQAGSGGVGGEAETQGRCWAVASAAPGGGDGSAWVGPGRPGPPPYPRLCCPRPLWGHEDRDRSEDSETRGWRNKCPWGLGTSRGWSGRALSQQAKAWPGSLPCERRGSPEAVEVEAWSSSGWPVCRSTRSISNTSIHWLSSCLSSANRCCVAIFSRASRSISCSYSFSFLFRDWRARQGKAGYPEQPPRGPQYCQHLPTATLASRSPGPQGQVCSDEGAAGDPTCLLGHRSAQGGSVSQGLWALRRRH